MVITSRMFRPFKCDHLHYVYMGAFHEGGYAYEVYRCNKCGRKEEVFVGDTDTV